MRLINLPSLKFEEFLGENIPKYGILSHTWGNEEVSYHEMLHTDRPELLSKAGYRKVRECCAKSEAAGLAYVWIDTCCIDKTSSAELTEAINSMFQWYANAEICWAYLEDVSLLSTYYWRWWDKQFHESRWFKRGWTLQELLAPKDIIFLSREWTSIGPKAELLDNISYTARIDTQHLHDFRKASVAAKMSWASQRKTTRIEDIAYSLMGLFNVNMPLLYGEGAKAFIRLQEEIIKISDDETIFAWTDDTFGESGILAQSPAAFADSRFYISGQFPYLKDRPPYTVTHKGLAIDFTLTPHRSLITSFFVDSVDTVSSLAALRCCKSITPAYHVSIELRRIGDREFVRSQPSKLFQSMVQGSRTLLCYIRPIYTSVARLQSERYTFIFERVWDKNDRLTLLDTSFEWDKSESSRRTLALPAVTMNSSHFIGVLFGFEHHSELFQVTERQREKSRLALILQGTQHQSPKAHVLRADPRKPMTRFAIMLQGSRYQAPQAHVLMLYAGEGLPEIMQYYAQHFFNIPNDRKLDKGFVTSVSLEDISLTSEHTDILVKMEIM